MNKFFKISLLILLLALNGTAQTVPEVFDTTQFNKDLELAGWLVDCEYFTQVALDYISPKENVSVNEWFSYYENKTWHTAGGISIGGNFIVQKHFVFDSLNDLKEYTEASDTAAIIAAGNSLVSATKLFQLIRDTSNMYFSSFVFRNPDSTISAWFLPSLQPSGQAIYGCEWEYIFDKTGKNFLRLNLFTNIVTGVWIGQPRELWLNYRNSRVPTVGSLFFALSFRDYFTRIRIDTQLSTSTISKDKNGIYTWLHKLK